MAIIRRGDAEAAAEAPRASAGVIASSNGRVKQTPAPRRKVRRDKALDGMQMDLLMK
jgi:hypothetical protein